MGAVHEPQHPQTYSYYVHHQKTTTTTDFYKFSHMPAYYRQPQIQYL